MSSTVKKLKICILMTSTFHGTSLPHFMHKGPKRSCLILKASIETGLHSLALLRKDAFVMFLETCGSNSFGAKIEILNKLRKALIKALIGHNRCFISYLLIASPVCIDWSSWKLLELSPESILVPSYLVNRNKNTLVRY